MAKAKTSYWSHPPLLEAIEKHIKESILIKSRGGKTGVDYLHHVIAKEFEEFFEKDNHKFTKFSLNSRLPSLIWNKERGGLIEEYVTNGWPLERFYEAVPYLPKDIVEARVRFLRGRGVKKKPVEPIRGLFRLISEGEVVKPVNIPPRDIKQPVALRGADDANGLMIIHGPSIGLPYPGDMKKNVLRCALEIAQREGMAVLITGGLFHMNLKQAHGNTQNRRARTSAMDLDMEIFSKEYRETAESEIENGDGDFPVTVSLNEKVANLGHGLMKSFRHSAESGGGPRYDIPIGYVSGAQEELLVTIGAYAEIRHRVYLRRHELASEMRELKALLRSAKKDIENLLEGGLYDSKARRAFEHSEKQMIAIQKKLEAKSQEQSKTIISNTHDQDHIRAHEKVRSWLLGKLQEAMPGVKILGYLNAFVKYKDAVIEVVAAGGENPSVTVLDQYIKKSGNDKTRHGELPDAILLANQYNPHFSYTYINERKSDAGKVKVRDVPVMMPPVAVDGDHIQRVFSERGLNGGAKTEVQRMVGHELFKPGIVVLDRVSENWTCALYDIAAVQHLGGPLQKGETWQKRKGANEYVNIFNATDFHFGHPWMVTVWDGKEKRLMDQTSATIEIFRKNGGFGRMHFSIHQDDLLQGMNFPNYMQPHANLLSFGNYQEYVRRTGGKPALSEGEYLRSVLLQKVRSGSYREQEQLEMLDDMYLMPNRDFYTDVITTHVKSDIDLSGVSKFEGEPYSSKDIGVATFPNGNHHRNLHGNKNSNPIGEGFIVAKMLRAYLSSYPAARSFADRLFTMENNFVRAPMHGQEFLGLGVVDTKKGAKFGLHMAGHPTRKGPANGYPLENAAKNVVERGNFNGIFHSCETEVIGVGDIHKAAVLWGPKLFYYSCPAATTGDPFGDKGFAQSHTGNLVVSYPVEGVAKAPIRFTFFMTSWIDAWYERRFPIDMKKLVPDPA